MKEPRKKHSSILTFCMTACGLFLFAYADPLFAIIFSVLAVIVGLVSAERMRISVKKIYVICALCMLFLTSCGTKNSDYQESSKMQEIPSDNEEENRTIISDMGLGENLSLAEGEMDNAIIAHPKMKVHFIDVGQGDCTLIEYQEEYILIDAGPDSSGTKLQKYLRDNKVSKINYFILTHPDSDHIGGADVIVTKFDIEHIIMSSYIGDNDDYFHLVEALENKNYSWTIPSPGEQYKLGDVFITILQSQEYADANNSSICLRVDYDEIGILFTGDSEEIAENNMVLSDINVEADIYHVGHHGSYTSSSQLLLDEVKPRYAVISCGKDNLYCHPHQETLDRLREMNVAMFRTDVQGTIKAVTDGKEIEWSIDPSTKYEGGSSEYEREYRKSLSQSIENVTKTTENVLNDIVMIGVTGAISSENPLDYSDEQTQSSESTLSDPSQENISMDYLYIGNKTNMKLHRISCSGKLPKETNREYFYTLEEAEAEGYTLENQCQICKPFR